MQRPNKPDQIQVFFEIAMSIGASLELKPMAKQSILTYLKKLNCSSGAILQLHKTEEGILYFKNIISIPYKTKFSEEFKEIYKLIPNRTDQGELDKFLKKLPISKKLEKDISYYIMHLPDYGLLCLKKNGYELPKNILLTLKTINNKLAQACIACVKNNDLILAKEKAEESDKLKTAFIENISHEIRTPLNSIMGYSSLIADRQISDKMIPNACQSIVKSSDILLGMIEDLIDISMLNSGSLKLRYSLLNINELLRDLGPTFEKHAGLEKKEGLSFNIMTPDEDFFIVSDAIRLHQIFDNLISNAVRFSDEGEIEVGYRKDPIRKNDSKAPHITFFIKDNGIGIPANKQQEIFKAFFKIENTKEKLYGGTGIGLTISKRLLELLDGKIWIESKPNIETTFYFSIPIIKSVDELISHL